MTRVSGAVNVPIAKNLAMRLAAQALRSDGFRENAYLERDDTNRRHEDFFRAKVLYGGQGNIRLKATLFFANLDNGYDAWTPDNNKELITFSDKPGQDRRSLSIRTGSGPMLVIPRYPVSCRSALVLTVNESFWFKSRLYCPYRAKSLTSNVLLRSLAAPPKR